MSELKPSPKETWKTPEIIVRIVVAAITALGAIIAASCN